MPIPHEDIADDFAHAAQALAELRACWLAGHYPPELRKTLLDHHVEQVRALTAHEAKRVWGQ